MNCENDLSFRFFVFFVLFEFQKFIFAIPNYLTMEIEQIMPKENIAIGDKKYFKMGWAEVLTLVSGFVLAQLLVGAILLVLSFISTANWSKSEWFMPLSYFLVMSAPIAIFYGVFMKPYQLSWEGFNSKLTVVTGVLALGMMVGMMFVSEYIVSLIPISGSFFGPIYESFSQQMENITSSAWPMVLMTVIFAPILEELLFRGIIMKGMLNMKVSPAKAIVFSAAIFGLIHGYPWQAVGAFMLGLVLGFVYYKTKSLVLPIMLHAFNNGIASLMISKFEVENFAHLFLVSEFIILIVGIVVLLIFGFLFHKHINKTS